MLINTVEDFRKTLESGPYAWPGGYPCYFVMADGEALSFDAAKENAGDIEAALLDPCRHGDWKVCGFDVNWEDASLFCSHTNKRIESAYAEDDAA
jgi:hypothetical protein